MLPVVNIGPLALQVPGLLLLAGLWISMWLVDRESTRLGLRGDWVGNMIFYGLLAGVLGARLGYALRFVDIYLDDPLALLSLNTQTFSPLEGAIAALIVAVVYGQRKGLPLLPTLDALAPGASAFAVSLGLAHLASGDAFGAPTAVPWAVTMWGAERHPSQVYEIAAAGLILAGILGLRRRAPFQGFTFALWTALAAGSRLILEAFRGDSVVVMNTLRQAQLVSLLVLLGSLLALQRLGRKQRKVPPER
jgi:prolipoprotein diacylglyceryltransferase